MSRERELHYFRLMPPSDEQFAAIRRLSASGMSPSAIAAARLLYPTADIPLAKHEVRAEALFLAHYGFTRRQSAKAGAA